MVHYDRPTNRWCLGTAFDEVLASAAGAGLPANIDSNPPLSGWTCQADVADADVAATMTHCFFAERHSWDLVALRSAELKARQSAEDHKSIMDVSLLLFFSEQIAERRRRTAYAIHVAQFGRIWHNLAQLERVSVYIVMLHFFCNGVVGNTHTQSAAIN